MVPGEQNPPAPLIPRLMLRIFNHVTHEMFETVELSHHSTCGTKEIHDDSWCACVCVYICIYVCVCVCVCVYTHTHTHTHTIPDVLAIVYTGHLQISSLTLR